MDFNLDSVEVRVLGSLLEKDLATPDYYPLSLNALTNACNQKTSREPIVNYDEQTVEEALGSLRAKHLAFVRTGGSRVAKHGHDLGEALNLGRPELAALCVLLLRGAQTLGEIRDRTHRTHDFADLEAVEACLRRLAELETPLAIKLSRPGWKEPRYAHLLGSGDPQFETAPASEPGRSSRLEQLEQDVAALQQEVAELRTELRKLTDALL